MSIDEDSLNLSGFSQNLEGFNPPEGATPHHFRVVLGEQESVAKDIAQLLPGIIKRAGALPKNVQKNDFFRVLLQDVEKIIALGHRRLLIPMHSNEAAVQAVLREISGTIEAKISDDQLLGQSRDAVREKVFLALNVQLRGRLEEVFNSPILTLEKGEKLSPRQIKEAFHQVDGAVKDQLIPEAQAGSSLFRRLGIISDEEFSKHSSEIEGQIESSLHWASDFIKKRLETIEELAGVYERDGKLVGNNELPELNQTLRVKSGFFQLLNHLYNDKEVRDLNDAQILLVLTLVHFIQERRYKRMETDKVTKVADGLILDSLFEETQPRTATYNTLYYQEGKFKPTGASRTKSCRTLKTSAKVPEAKKMISLLEVDDKLVPSRVKKYFSEGNGESGPDKLPDEIRTRGILMGVTSAELAEKGPVQDMVIESLLNAAKSLGLRYDVTEALKDDTRPALKLREGEFMIEKDFNHPNYPKMNLLAVTGEGLHVEIQFICVDTYAFEMATGSGINHKIKDEEIELKMMKDMAVQSISPVTHTIANLRLDELADLRGKTRQARKDFMEEQPDFFKMAA